MRWLPVVLVLLISAACSGPPNKFSDPVLVKIYDLKDRRSTDSLLTFLQADNALYRREAALAFGSVQDTTAAQALGTALLEDPDADVRKHVAFALGQTKCVQSVNALIPALEDKDGRVVREVLEALGKTMERRDVPLLCEFKPGDTLVQEGQARAFYQLAIRKVADSMVTQKVIAFLIPPYAAQTRLAAAHYFGRSTVIEGSGFKDNLLRAALTDERPDVRMAAVNGFRHLAVDDARPALLGIVKSDKDYRVRVNAVRVCQNFRDKMLQEMVLTGLSDSTEAVRTAASEVVRNTAERYEPRDLDRWINDTKSFRARANLYAAMLRTSPPDGLLPAIVKRYASESLYSKALLLSALGDARSPTSRDAFQLLTAELLKQTNEMVLLTSAASGLVSLNRNPAAGIPKSQFLEIYEKAVALGDPAVIGIISSALTDKSLGYKEAITDLTFLYSAKAKLQLPKDIESLQPLERAIAFLEGKDMPPTLENEFNHAINWNVVKTIPADQCVELLTDKGQIVLQLAVNDSPGSVANFLDLVNGKYFDGKVFHRVVPNFVIQGGCNRGDGYGSENYSIRSEFSLRRYTTGSVGMASAGKDTEGTQWFITHSPTPHLDGKYSIFATVIEGAAAVDRMEIGDRILEAKLRR